MGDRRLLSVDENTGLQTFHEHDALTDETRIIHIGETTSVIERNKVLANDADFTKKGIKQEFWMYASIPAGVQVKWLVEHGVDVWDVSHGERIGKLLELPEYKYLKTTTGHHKFKDR